MLTDEDKSKILDWFFKRCPNASCPMCRTPFYSGGPTANFDLHDHRVGFQDILIENQKVVPQGKGKVVIYFICMNCAYVMMFDVLNMGLNQM